jgi:CDP-diacylglycerol--glycerol-3-phosphate 3-phosphatidyltransferase
MTDYACSLFLVLATLFVAVAYRARVAMTSTRTFERIERAGSSPLLGKGPMLALYWALQPVARACIALGVTANQISWLSLVGGIAAAAALCAGHFGVAAAFSVVASIADALDGIVARETGTASDAGETLDATVDRYVEFLFLAGLGVYYREHVYALGLVLLALLGSIMVSYGTAKAEALHVEPPRGAMRRAERAVYLTAGVAFAPIAGFWLARYGVNEWWASAASVLLALAIVGLVANVSAVRRLVAVAAAARARAPGPVETVEKADGDASLEPMEVTRSAMR